MSPFEQDTLRKKTTSAPAPDGHEGGSDNQEGPVSKASATPAQEASGGTAHHTEPRSREENWANAVMNQLEERQRFGLASMLEWARWEFGEGEVRIHLTGTGIAKAMPQQDRQTLEQMVSETMGRKIRLSLVDDAPAGGNAIQGRRGAKAPAKAASANDPAVETQVRQDPEVKEFEQLFGKSVSGIRPWKE
jgi:hypothetical protein